MMEANCVDVKFVGDENGQNRHQSSIFSHWVRASTFKRCHQYRNSVTNINLSPCENRCISLVYPFRNTKIILNVNHVKAFTFVYSVINILNILKWNFRTFLKWLYLDRVMKWHIRYDSVNNDRSQTKIWPRNFHLDVSCIQDG